MTQNLSPKQSPHLTPNRTLLSKLGLPDLSGNARFVAANIIDSLAGGLVIAFLVVYFARTTSLSLVEVGACLTLGHAIALPVPALAGWLLDRVGPRTVVASGNLVSALGFVCLFFAESAWQIVVTQCVVQTGAAMYWTSSSALVTLVARDDDRTRWFGFFRALRNVGIGFGGAIAALAMAMASTTGLKAVVAVQAVSYLLAAWLLRGWRPNRAEVAGHHGERPEGGVGGVGEGGGHGRDGADPPAPRAAARYATVLRDGAYMRLVAANLSFVLASMVLSVLLGIYATDSLGAGAWVGGVLITLNTVLVATTQTLATRWIERHRSTRVIVLACLVNAVAFGVFAALSLIPVRVVPAGLLVAVVIYTLAEVLGSPPMGELSVYMAPEHARGRYLGVYQLSWSLGGAVAPVVLTSLLSLGPAWPWLFLAALSLLAAPLVLSLEPRPARS
ncbi:MFS transporter [Streptomyces sp. WAC 01529]|uniref:MFS transporter n=1 Tax=Streptomyces sp. WAC 01529 TaxID=2203205 RepID=UPI000F6E6BD2|nr:MFS transporter [Streptomyces sp. WAC 01529]AZM56027.1 MFS transporter [Streptomyces sp. WAC 01529]